MIRGELSGKFEAHCGIDDCPEWIVVETVSIEDADRAIRDMDWGLVSVVGWLCPEHAYESKEASSNLD
jgi:hypothetical protein